MIGMNDALAAPHDEFAAVKERLVRDGLSETQVAMAFEPPPEPLFGTVAQTMRIREGRLNYGQFLQPAALTRARQFQKTHEPILARAEKTSGVDRSVIVAILLVETGFGSYTGKTPTLAIFSTFALMNQESARDRIWAMLSPSDRERWGREKFDQKLLDRSRWAYGELTALLRWCEEQGKRPESFKGSVMGALGWPQFLPSSLVRFGKDGNRDGRVDPYHPEDAIFSIANYLRGHGWCEAKSQEQREAVIHCYNKSQPYVQAVLGVASRLDRKS